MKIDLNIQPWQTPNFIRAEPKPVQRQDGFNPDSQQLCWHVKDVDIEVLCYQLDKFRADVFKKAGKIDPKGANNV